MFEKYVPQIFEAWRRITPQRRLGYAIIAILAISAIVGVGVWSSQPEYVFLFEDLTPAEYSRVVDALESSNISYRSTFAGSVVMVPKHAYASARRATSAFQETPAEGEQELAPDNSFTGLIPDPDSQARARLTERERQLEKMLEQLNFVDTAKVKLAFPKSSNFLRATGDVTATVVVTPSKSYTLTGRNAHAIAAMVASAVEGLSSEKVVVSDPFGNVLSEQGDFGGHFASQQEYERNTEAQLEAYALHVLEGALGPGRSRIAVNCEFDFTRRLTKETRLDQQNGVEIRREEQKNSEVQPDLLAGGGAGATANANKTTKNNGTLSKQETTTSEFEPGKTISETEEVQPKLLRLTVAAVVDNLGGADGGSELVKLPDLENLLKTAVGFDDTRGDMLNVTQAKLPQMFDPEAVGAPPATQWGQIQSLLQSASLGISALAALIIAWIALRKFQPLAMAVPQGESLSGKDLQRIRGLAAEAEQDPELVAAIVRSLLADDAVEEKPSKGRQAALAA